MAKKESAESTVRNIRRKTRKKYSAEEKIRIVIEGLRGESTVAELCRRLGVRWRQWGHCFTAAGLGGFAPGQSLLDMGNPVVAARTAIGGAAQAQSVMIAVFALAISLGNILGGQLAERIGWLALPWQTVVFCSLAWLVTYFGIRPRLKEGSNEPDPELLLTTIEMDE